VGRREVGRVSADERPNLAPGRLGVRGCLRDHVSPRNEQQSVAHRDEQTATGDETADNRTSGECEDSHTRKRHCEDDGQCERDHEAHSTGTCPLPVDDDDQPTEQRNRVDTPRWLTERYVESEREQNRNDCAWHGD
jgi:hypothetical protein